MIEFNGQIDQKLYVRALRLQGGGATVIGIMLAAVGAWGLTSATAADPKSWGVPLFAGLLGVFLVLGPYLTARKGLSSSALLRAPFTGHADESSIVFESSYGRTEMPWPLVYRALAASDVVFLFTSAHQFHILARPFFRDDDAWSSFRELAMSKVVQIHPRRSLLKVAAVWCAITLTIS
jgi:hypothetical protein